MVRTTQVGLTLRGRKRAVGRFGFCHRNSLELLGRMAFGFPFSEKDLKSHEWLEIKPNKVMTPNRRENRKYYETPFVRFKETMLPNLHLYNKQIQIYSFDKQALSTHNILGFEVKGGTSHAWATSKALAGYWCWLKMVLTRQSSSVICTVIVTGAMKLGGRA